MPSFLGREIDPLVGSKSPASIFIKVVLPAPLGPVIAYRRPAIKLQVTSSNRILPPNRIVMLLTESIAFNYSVELIGVLEEVRLYKRLLVSLFSMKSRRWLRSLDVARPWLRTRSKVERKVTQHGPRRKTRGPNLTQRWRAKKPVRMPLRTHRRGFEHPSPARHTQNTQKEA